MNSTMSIANSSNKEKRARKRVRMIKSWYWLIPIYALGTAIMVFLTFFIDPPFWMKLILLAGPVLWWVFFVIQGIHLFLPKTDVMKNWENRQIKKILVKQQHIK